MAIRTLTKLLAGAQDMLWGRGVATQVRNGTSYNINRIQKIHPVDLLVDLKALPTLNEDAQYFEVIMKGTAGINDGNGGVFYFDAANTGAPDDLNTVRPDDRPSGPGRWVKQISDAILRTGDTMTGQLKGITPVATNDLTRKDYVDAAFNKHLAGMLATGLTQAYASDLDLIARNSVYGANAASTTNWPASLAGTEDFVVTTTMAAAAGTDLRVQELHLVQGTDDVTWSRLTTTGNAGWTTWKVLSADILDNVAALKATTPAADRVIYLKGHTTVNDGRGGEFIGVTGAPGTYTDDDAVTILPTGGDGSAAWKAVTASAPLTGQYLQVTSDIINGAEVSLMRFIPRSHHSAIRARTSTTDMTSYFQAAIDAMEDAEGGEIFVPYGDYKAENIVPKSGVTIRGTIGGQVGTGAAPTKGSRLISVAGNNPIFNQTTGTLYGFVATGLAYQGVNAGTNNKGVYFLNAVRSNVENSWFNNFAAEAIRIDGGVGCSIDDVFGQNILLDRPLVAKTGAIHVLGNDHFINRLEITPSVTIAVTSAGLYTCALFLGGSNHFVSNLVAEIADVGFRAECTNSSFTGVRADLNLGNGYEVTGGGNQFTACRSVSNGTATANTYDGWVVSGANNQFSACNANVVSGSHRYGFNDTVNSGTNKNNYSNCKSINHTTKSFNTVDYAGSSVTWPDGPAKIFTAGDTTPSVDQYHVFRTGGADSYTFFDDSVAGQSIEILAGHAATLVNSATLRTNTDVNVIMALNRTYRLRNWNGVWYMDGP